MYLPNDMIVQHQCGHRRVFTISSEMPLSQIAQVKAEPCSWCAYLAIDTDGEAIKHLPSIAGTHNLYWSFREEGMSVKKALQEVVERAVTRCPSCRIDYFLGERMQYCDQCKQIVCDQCFANPSHCKEVNPESHN
jgi:hypothetical protein